MTSNYNEGFKDTIPKHLTSVDWKNADYKRSVLACLVQGAYLLDTDSWRKNRCSYAEAWWTSFNFHLDQPLMHDHKCIFGAIYKYNGIQPAPDSDVPKYVIAFRGTLLKPKRWKKDLELNFKCFVHKLEDSSRFKLAMQHVEEVVEANGASNVCLAGHSLGAAIALLVGKKMVLERKWLQAYLFNPPFLSIPIELLPSEKVKKGIRLAHGAAKAVLVLAANHDHQAEDSFSLLSRWTPYLFVNPADIFCAAYIAFFERKVGAGAIMAQAENNSLRNLLNHVVLRKDLKDAIHLLPSAHLIVISGNHPNKKVVDNSSFSDFLRAHTISQWWRPDVHCQSTLYISND